MEVDVRTDAGLSGPEEPGAGVDLPEPPEAAPAGSRDDTDDAGDVPTRLPESAAVAPPLHRMPTRLTRLALGDRSASFALALALSWVALVGLPLILSVALNRSAHGIPLFCVVAWVVLLRVARRLSPPRRCERLLEGGRYGEALMLCEHELRVSGDQAWRGNRRLAWLNRTTNALLGLGRFGEASVVAVEALGERHDPETLGNLGLCLLYLDRDEEAADTARHTLDLTRERSVMAHAIMGAVYVRTGRPAEAQAATDAGLADVEALLPFARRDHHVALLATRCQADRMLRDMSQAARDLATMRKVAGTNTVLQASVALEQADTASSQGDTVQALAALRRAIALAPHGAAWYASQPHTFQELRGDEAFEAALVEARETWRERAGPLAPEHGAAPPAYIASEIAAPPDRAHAQPARHASWRALLAQALTLAGTLALLVWWTWHFFLSAG